MNNGIVEDAKLYVEELLNKELKQEYFYHNWEHTKKVFDAVNLLSEKEKVEAQDQELLALAALFHDTGFVNDFTNHEENSKKIARKFLEKINYPDQNIKQVENLINVTKHNQVPEGLLENIMKDADFINLADSEYMIWSERLRQENMALTMQKKKKTDWLEENIKFFKDHRYRSEAAMELYQDAKNQNLVELEKIYEARIERKEKKAGSISTSKSAQTQFKTALRNHIDLSAIADNKANIMLSVNALILTISLPFLGREIGSNPILFLPALCLLITCVLSIVYATLSTRPVKMHGVSKPEDIRNNSSNLFFFGNFFKMNIDEYTEGIKSVIAEEERLDSSITRDLFMLGKTLGKKYSYLRNCYNIFMYGIILTAIAFAIVFGIASN